MNSAGIVVSLSNIVIKTIIHNKKPLSKQVMVDKGEISLKIKAPAKINLALDVVADRADGYHEVDMVMQSLELADEITIKLSERLQLGCSNKAIPTDRNNLAWQAAELLAEAAGKSAGAEIYIEKRIPMAAGLAGGSADAAGVLLGLNQLWGLGYSRERLMELALKLGADVPYCILQQTARAQGVGERLTVVPARLKCGVFIVTPNVPVATPWVYRHLDTPNIARHPHIDEVLEALIAGDLSGVVASWGNVLEEVVLPAFPVVRQLKERLLACGLKYNLMSGSGPTVFALDPPEEGILRFMAEKPAQWYAVQTKFLE